MVAAPTAAAKTERKTWNKSPSYIVGRKRGRKDSDLMALIRRKAGIRQPLIQIFALLSHKVMPQSYAL